MKLFSALFKSKNNPANAAPSPSVPQQTEPVYLTQTVVFGHGDSSVYFVDKNRGIRKMLIDAIGNIRNFPGIRKESFWVKKVSANALNPKIRYRTNFEKRKDKWLMLWTIQPDGDYWRDEDGFGAENEDEVVLHAYVDMNGDFTGPFCIYEIGGRCYSLDRFEWAHEQHYADVLEMLRANKMEDDQEDILFPRLHGMDLRAGIHRLSEYYTLWNKEDAITYWQHPILRAHLEESAQLLLQLEGDPSAIFGWPNHKGVHACMTLFYFITREPVFKEVLDKFFDGKSDEYTIRKLSADV